MTMMPLGASAGESFSRFLRQEGKIPTHAVYVKCAWDQLPAQGVYQAVTDAMTDQPVTLQAAALLLCDPASEPSKDNYAGLFYTIWNTLDEAKAFKDWLTTMCLGMETTNGALWSWTATMNASGLTVGSGSTAVIWVT